MCPLPSSRRSPSPAMPSPVTPFWFTGSSRTQQLQSIPVPEMVTTAMMLPHQQLRDSPITGQSNHSMKGDIFWLRAVPGTCTVHKKAKLEELGWPDLSLCNGEWSRVLSPLRSTHHLFPPTLIHFIMTEQGETTGLVLPLVFPAGGCTQPGV